MLDIILKLMKFLTNMFQKQIKKLMTEEKSTFICIW